jgi:hypothetical protein
MRDLETIAKNLASLNEITYEIVAKLNEGSSCDGDFVVLVHDTLQDLTWQLGFSFQEQHPTAEWHDAEEKRIYQKRLREVREGRRSGVRRIDGG